MHSRNWLASGLCLLLTTSSFADFRYEETTKITGGAMVGMMKFAGAFSKDAKQAMAPNTSTVVLKGNRLAHINPNTTEIIDLDKETITNIDHRKKQYTVMTFQQMKQQMLDAQKKAKEEQAKQKAKQQPSPQEPSTPPPDMKFKVSVKNTGATKTVSGLSTKESILSMAMEATDQKSGQKGALAITNDMWMAPEIPGYGEVRDFNKRFAIKMGTVFSDVFKPQLAAMQPGTGEGMAEMVKEMSKLSGVPVLQIMRVGTTANGAPLPAASEAPLPPSNSPEMPSAGEVAQQSAASAITSKLGLGGFGFGHKKKKDEPQPQETTQKPQSQGAQSADAGVLMESSTELTSFSSAPIDPSQFNVPPGYSQIPMNQGGTGR